MSREVLSPPLQRMGPNRCYRVNLVHDDFGGHPTTPGKMAAKETYVEPDLYGEADEDDNDESTFQIEELPNSVYKLTMHVAQTFYGGLVGFKGSTKRRIETETKTEIYVPRSGGGKKTTEDVSIKGTSRDNVCTARRKIITLTQSLRKRMRPTHFVCVPLNDGQIKQNYIELKKQILALNLPGIDETLFQDEGRIHITLNTCILLDEPEREKGVELLQSCREYLADLQTPFMVRVAGLEIMNDDPSAVRVLYARVEAPVLQQFGDRVYSSFVRSGLGFTEFGRDTVKMHMTIMNNRYGEKEKAKTAKNFDAREILKSYGDFNFGEAQCSSLHLCVLGSSREPGTFYKMTGSLNFEVADKPLDTNAKT